MTFHMKIQMLSQSHFPSLNRSSSPISLPSSPTFSLSDFINPNSAAVLRSSALKFPSISRKLVIGSGRMSCVSAFPNQVGMAEVGFEDSDLDRFAQVANRLADAAGEVIRKYFRKSFDILDKEDLSWFSIFVTSLYTTVNRFLVVFEV